MVARAVLDTNVLVSAYAFGGVPADLVRAAIGGRLEIVTSPAILAELARVLGDKLGFDQPHVVEVVKQVARIATVVRPERRVEVIADDADNRVLEAALLAGADVIVSGDRHLLAVGEWSGIRVLTPAAALAEIA